MSFTDVASCNLSFRVFAIIARLNVRTERLNAFPRTNSPKLAEVRRSDNLCLPNLLLALASWIGSTHDGGSDCRRWRFWPVHRVLSGYRPLCRLPLEGPCHRCA